MLTLKCNESSNLVNNNWSDKFQVKCKSNGKFEKVKPWPQCVPPANCGKPPPPHNTSGLSGYQDDSVDILVPNKAVYYCNETLTTADNETIEFVTDLGKIIELPCEKQEKTDEYNFTIPCKYK